MSVVRHRNSGTPRVRQWANLFAITNLHELSSGYRLLYVRGLARGERYDKNVNRLAKSVAYEIKQPVALTRCGNAHALAIPAGASLPSLEQQLMPDVATLVPEAQTRPLNFMSLDYETGPIAINFLQFALRAPLREDPSLWGSGRAFYRKDPLDIGGARTNVDVYPGFVWNLVIDGDSRVFLALDTTVRYVDHRWLPERLDGDE